MHIHKRFDNETEHREYIAHILKYRKHENRCNEEDKSKLEPSILEIINENFRQK